VRVKHGWRALAGSILLYAVLKTAIGYALSGFFHTSEEENPCIFTPTQTLPHRGGGKALDAEAAQIPTLVSPLRGKVGMGGHLPWEAHAPFYWNFSPASI
jgi:hypothetical protein